MRRVCILKAFRSWKRVKSGRMVNGSFWISSFLLIRVIGLVALAAALDTKVYLISFKTGEGDIQKRLHVA
jgi:hypothetical protein